MNKLNKYVFSNFSKSDHQIVLYNSYTREVCALESFDGDVERTLDNISEEQEKYFSDHYFFETRNGICISDYVEETRNKIKYSRKSASFTIHLSYGCNMKCSYCYQNDIKDNVFLDEKTEKDLYVFFEKVKKLNELEVVSFVFIGGEPLLFSNMMFRLIENINMIFDKQKRRYSIVTNGTLFTSDLINRLRKYDWDYIQVTLDGPKNVHYGLRVFKNNAGSFDEVISGIKKCNDIYLPVVININISRYNYESISELLEFFKQNNINNEIQFSYIFECNTNLQFNNSSFDFSKDFWKKVHLVAKKYGYRFSPFYRLSYMVCGSQRINNFVISPKGELYKCLSGIGTKEYYLSNINDYASEDYWNKLSQFVEYDNLKEKCYQCKYEIVCGGWCRYKKNIYGDYCPYEELEKNDRQMIFRCM